MLEAKLGRPWISGLDGRHLVKRTLDRSPCPTTSSFTIGSSQQFQLQCGLVQQGQDLQRLPASSLLACVNLCTASHPRCVGVVFRSDLGVTDNSCWLKSTIGDTPQQGSFYDSAVAVWPTDVQEDCGSIESGFQSQGVTFDAYCGQDYPHDDYAQVHSKTFAECISRCASDTTPCAGVSYEASMQHGYNNCYLKYWTSVAGLYTQAFVVDSAFVRPGSAKSSLSQTASKTSVTASLGLVPSSSSALPISTTTSQSSAQQPPHSNAWIAGVVTGPLLLIAILAFLVWFFCSRKKNHEPSQVPHSTSSIPKETYGTSAEAAPQGVNYTNHYYPISYNGVGPGHMRSHEHYQMSPEGTATMGELSGREVHAVRGVYEVT